MSFCFYFDLPWLPTNAETLCLYAQLLSKSFKSPSSIQNYISGAKCMHILTDIPCPAFGSIELKLSLRGISRINPHCTKQASPMTPTILFQIHSILNHQNPVHATMWCLFLVAFYSLSRKSNLVVTGSKFDASKQLCRSDIKVGSDGMLIKFRWTKTIQFGQKVLEIPLLAVPQSCLCPLRAYKNMVNLVPAVPAGPAFVIPSKFQPKPVTYRFLQQFLKRAVSIIGEDSTKFSSHSFRRGGATWAFRSQVPADLIKVQGDWSSQAYMRYLDFSLDQRMQVSQQMIQHILQVEHPDTLLIR